MIQILTLLLLLLTSLSAFAEKVILPLSPSTLLSFLAPAPESWIMVKSKAGNVYSGNLICIADRTFELASADTQAESKKEKRVLTVQLTDTGKASSRLSMFNPLQAGSTLTMLEGFPLIKVPSTTGEKMFLLISGRFILAAEVSGSDKTTLEKYLKKTIQLIKKSSNLNEISVEMGKPLTYTEEFVDELNPKLNRKFQSSALPAFEIDPPTQSPITN
jgi:hypothetical protein